jgi:uncharacterized protein (TIGR00369 family)
VTDAVNEAPFVDDGRCFACGPRSELGLKMRFTASDGGVCAETVLPAWLQGWRGVAHGGIVTLLLDEAMAHAAGAAGLLGVTADLNVRFRKPVPLGEPVRLIGRVLRRRRNVLDTEAELIGSGDRLLASASARFVVTGQLPPGVRLGEFDEHG